MAKVLIVIPARFASTRFPGKLLKKLCGVSILQRVYQQAVKAKSKKNWEICIATDDTRIQKHAKSFGADVIMTSRSCKSGSDRCAEIARKRSGADIVVNLQGDEPFLPPNHIRAVVEVLIKSRENVATLATPLINKSDSVNPNVVKAVITGTTMKHALYFSRSSVPFPRNNKNVYKMFQHIGIYAFRRKYLLKFSKMKPTPLELTESLEQLRILENGDKIAIAIVRGQSIGIDTPGDLRKAERLIKKKK